MQLHRPALVALALVLSAACAPAAAPAPTAKPAAPTAAPAAAKPTEAPKPAASPAAKPAASPAASPAAKPAGQAFDQAAWDRTVAAARQEGKVVIIGPQGADVRDSLVVPFQAKYPEIEVDFSGPSPAQIPPKLLGELSANQFLTDLIIGGTTTILGTLVPANAVVPLAPYLTGPNATNPSPWLDGTFDYADTAARFNLVFGARVQIPFVYNPSLLNPSEITSYQDLLDPKWQGKLAMYDPTVPGAGLDLATFMYTNEDKGLGKEYLRKFFAQGPAISRDNRQVLDWVARGDYPIALGPNGVQAFELKGSGLPLELFPGEDMAEGGFATASTGTVAAIREAPHPNAARVYIDFLLSAEGQAAWSQASGLASRRTDVSSAHLPPSLVQRPNVEYQQNHKERYVELRDEIIEFIRPLMQAS